MGWQKGKFTGFCACFLAFVWQYSISLTRERLRSHTALATAPVRIIS